MLHRIFVLALALAAALAATGAGAQGPTTRPVAAAGQPQAPMDPAEALARWDAEATDTDQRLATTAPGATAIDAMRAGLEAQRAEIAQLIAEIDERLAPLRGQLDALGPAPDDPALDPAAIAAERDRLATEIARIEADQRRASQAAARAAALLADLADRRRILFTNTMLSRGPSPLDPSVIASGLDSLARVGGALWGETDARVRAQRMDADLLAGLVVPVLLIGAASFVMLTIKRLLLTRLLAGAARAPRRRVVVALAVTLIRLILPATALALTLAGLFTSDLIGPLGAGLLRGLTDGAALVIGAYALGGAFFAPNAPELRLSVLDNAQAAAAHRRLILLAAVVGFDSALVIQGQVLGVALEGLSLLNALMLVGGGVALWAVIAMLTPAPLPEVAAPGDGDEIEGDPVPAPLVPVLLRIALTLGRLAAVAAPVLALAGYYAAARYAFYPLVFSGALIALCILVFQASRETVEEVFEPGTDATSGRRRIRLIPVMLGFALFCVAVPLLALIWGADVTDLQVVWRRIADGFQVGEAVISPADFAGFLLVFTVGYALTRMAQGILRRSVLPLTGLDAGARAAITAGIGYLGVFLSAAVAISTTGLDLSSLAIVAGALSVGIGFGLQNIVNNFVSGLILLIERPIKTGDWVDLASGSGYVKKVNVRSTEIETFDRATLFVPNSELISSTVTNWTHNNLNGRIIVKVGVAYGTDPRKVERILLEIAKGHPMVLRRPAPFVLFRNFGPDTLEFEIRAILRDVNWVLNVGSDINFEIASRFGAEGIEVPHPQRDLWLKNADELGEAIGRAVARPAPAAAPDAPSRVPPAPRPPTDPDAPPPPDPRRSEDPESGRGDRTPPGPPAAPPQGSPAAPPHGPPTAPPRGRADGDDPDPIKKVAR